jgi:hypothetical protein
MGGGSWLARIEAVRRGEKPGFFGNTWFLDRR